LNFGCAKIEITMSFLVETLINQGYIKTKRVEAAFRAVPRYHFLFATGKSEKELKKEAEINAPLSLFSGQTISQPLTVALMLELLGARRGNKILDVGSGSGWQACLLAHIAGEKGKVYALEILPELKEFGEQNAKKFDFDNIKFILGNGWQGARDYAPFDRIIVAAATPQVPSALKEQLKVGGVIVIPVGTTHNCALTRIEKLAEDDFEVSEEPGFSFVPLIDS